MPFVRSHGADIYYERHGDGPALLFCHGAGSNAATWWQQIPHFSQRFTCLTYDHRCFGRSAAPPESMMPELLVDDALAVLDAERIARAALVCQSLGGVTGLRLALRHRERVWAFVPCDSPLGIAHPELLLGVRRYAATVEATRLEDRALGPSFVRDEAALVFLYGQINRFNPAVFGAQAGVASWSERLRRLVAADNLVPTQRLREIACPTLFVVGEHDPLVTAAVMHDVARHVPDGEVVEIAGAGHSAYFERPRAFNAAVGDFLALHAGL